MKPKFFPGRLESATADEIGLKSFKAPDGTELKDLVFFKGFANTRTMDRDQEAILETSFEKAIPAWMEHPAVTLGHEFNAARAVNIGRVTSAEVRKGEDGKGSGLFVRGYIGTNKAAQDIRTNLAENIPMDFSIAFMDAETREATDEDRKVYGEKTTRVVTGLELLPLGIVNVGSNRHSHVVAGKSFQVKATPEEVTAIIQRVVDLVGQVNEALSGLMGSNDTPADGGEPGADQTITNSAEVDAFALAAKGWLNQLRGQED